MLSRLSIENYALIDRLEIRFAPGLNIITGETGAGKSILLGALGLILGYRTDASVIKNQECNCIIEGEFDVSRYRLQPLFAMLEAEYDDITIIRRVITPAGKSRAYINDLPVQLTTLRTLAERFIDIHSQHQTLLLGDNMFQIELLDSVASHDTLLENYKKTYDSLRQTERQAEILGKQIEQQHRDRDYISFQLEEFHSIKLLPDEQHELETLLSELTHAAEIKEALQWSGETLCHADENLLARLKETLAVLTRVAPFYPAADAFCARLESSMLEIKDIAEEISAEEQRVEDDPQRMEEISGRLDRIYALQQKHRVSSISELLILQTDYEQRLEQLDAASENIETLIRTIGQLREQAQKLASEISAGRRKAIPHIEQQVSGMLCELGMNAAQIQIEIEPGGELSATGADRIRFLFTANKNVPLQPIEQVASGGEMSRLMLSLKTLVAHHRQLPTLIFDEIDTGVSGSIADKMGRIISRLSERLQVINITHLPQVASKGETHFLVYKEEADRSTVTRIRQLTPEQRIEEIAKMLSGSSVTQAALQQARLLLDRTKK